jgi:hypothetical protein
LLEFFLNEKFIIPLLATLGASSTIILMQFYARRVKETKQKIYAVNYICDVAYRILFSEFILLRHTIKPHIEVTERITEGDHELLAKTFLTDEFDILKAHSPSFSHLPNEFSLQIGYDDINLVQIFETLLHLSSSEINRKDLNEFVKNNLKSMDSFVAKTGEEQHGILYTYHDYLTSLEHESNRIVFFILRNLRPAMKNYISSYRFWLYSTKNAKAIINQTLLLAKDNKDLIQGKDYMEKVKNGGIQGEL